MANFRVVTQPFLSKGITVVSSVTAGLCSNAKKDLAAKFTFQKRREDEKKCRERGKDQK